MSGDIHASVAPLAAMSDAWSVEVERREDSSVEPDVDPIVPGGDHVERHERRQRLETRPPHERRVQAVRLPAHGEASCAVSELDRPLERLAEHGLAIESGQDAG